MPELRLYHSRKKAKRFLERHGIQFEPIETADAQTWTFHDQTGSHAMVLMGSDTSHDFSEDMGMLAHEATHVVLFALGDIGEEEPAEEQMCYLVQAVCTWLCEAHFDWRARHLV